jgi:uncharacterized protein YdiU (UPF0061 family)
MEFVNTYAHLPERFFERTDPAKVRAPRLILWNEPLAEALGLPETLTSDREALASEFSGNEPLSGMAPLAMAYAGHQFGNFVPQLGDGRAHLLGELRDREGVGRDVQLKGSGPTAFSRGGDGRSALGPALREFIMSEAMHALGVPTTRSLAVVATGEPVMREQMLPGAVVTRVARSHLRVGTFQYFAVREDEAGLRTLADYAIARLFPTLSDAEGPERYAAFLDAVIEAQIELVMQWMRVGFIHGVMNTDNTALAGETIDYGPCAMMNAYDPATVFSSIDHRGRYAFGNQPAIIAWNLARFAETLLPLLADDDNEALERAQDRITAVPPALERAFSDMMGRKLGLPTVDAPQRELIAELLDRLRTTKADYTNTFDRLTRSLADEVLTGALREELGDDWIATWHRNVVDRLVAAVTMRRENPVVIPRNHHVEAVLAAVTDDLDPTPAEAFLEVLRAPYDVLPTTHEYRDPPPDGDRDYKTFCGT